MSSTITAKQDAAPAAPASGYTRLYSKADGTFYYMANDGVEHQLLSTDKSTALSVALALALG